MPRTTTSLLAAAALAVAALTACSSYAAVESSPEPTAAETSAPPAATETATEPAAAGTADDPIPSLEAHEVDGWEITWGPLERDQEEGFLAAGGSAGSVPLYGEGHEVIATDVTVTRTGEPSVVDVSFGISDGSAPIRSLSTIDPSLTVETGATTTIRLWAAVPADVLAAGTYGLAVPASGPLLFELQ